MSAAGSLLLMRFDGDVTAYVTIGAHDSQLKTVLWTNITVNDPRADVAGEARIGYRSNSAIEGEDVQLC